MHPALGVDGGFADLPVGLRLSQCKHIKCAPCRGLLISSAASQAFRCNVGFASRRYRIN